MMISNPRATCTGFRGLARALAIVVFAWAQWSAAQAAPQATAAQQAAPAPTAGADDPMVRNGLYVIQKGDEINIKVFQQPQLDDTVRVRPDGKVSLVLLSDAEAAGLTTKELEDKIASRYAQYYRDPKVSVIVRSFSNLKIYVGGEVGQPGVIALAGDMTALSAVMQAGGFRHTAKTDNVILVRNNGRNVPVARKVNLKAVLKNGEGDVALRPFDVVFVPKSKIARVDQFVDQYIRQVIPATLTAGFTYLQGNTSTNIPIAP